MTKPGRSRWCLPALLGLVALFAACNAVLTAFAMPGTALAGHEFVIAIAGSASGSNPSTGDNAGCVLQVPVGFTVTQRGPGTADDPECLHGRRW